MVFLRAYIARRLIQALPTALLVVTLAFVFARIIPGDPAVAALGVYASAEAVQSLRARMGLDAPLWAQYGRYLADLLRCDLGRSLVSGYPVVNQLAVALPHTLLLTILGMIGGVFLGLLLGVTAALSRNRLWDYVARAISFVGISVPAFYLGLLLMLAFSIALRLFPTMGAGDWALPATVASHLALPALTLALIVAGYTTRLSRSVLLDVLGEDYVRTAHAKGLSRRVVILRHAMRNTLIPVISLVGMYFATLVGSSVMVEIVFSRPGVGRLLVGAIMQRDYIMLQSVMVVYALFIIVVNLLTDISYGFVDPRIRYE